MQNRGGVKMIPMLDLKREYEYMKADVDRAIGEALTHQAWIMGPEVKKLEERVAAYVGTKFAVGCASGTDALVLALRALALKRTGKEYFTPADEVITTPFTFTATGDAIVRAGATPVFVDIDPRTFNIDPDRLREAVTGRTVGVIPVHLYGQACAMDEILDTASKAGLFVVEDVAQAFGAEHRGSKCGAIGDAGAFSFFPSKNLGGFGDGGMVTTNDAELAAMCDMLRKHGGKDKYNVDLLGYNSRLDTLQAAVLLAKLNHIDTFNGRRKKIASRYSLELAPVPGLVAPNPPQNGEHVFHQYTIRTANRNRLATVLKERGVASMVYYPVPLHRMKVFAGRSRVAGSVDECEKAAAEVLSLPIEPLLTPQEMSAVVEAVSDGAK
jgi:dTDP-4-amino-4,6-dideoxygalactose transaminase